MLNSYYRGNTKLYLLTGHIDSQEFDQNIIILNLNLYI